MERTFIVRFVYEEDRAAMRARFGDLVPERGPAQFVETDPALPAILEFIEAEGRMPPEIRRVYSAEELARPDAWFAFVPRKLSTYPAPDGSFADGVFEAYCYDCGTHDGQIGALRVSPPPKRPPSERCLWGVHWLEFEYFCAPGPAHDLLAEHGLTLRSVEVVGRRCGPLWQLDLTDVESVAFEVDPGRECNSCESCGRLRVELYTGEEILPAPGEARSSCVISEQWFGSGGMGFRYIAFRGELARALRGLKPWVEVSPFGF